MINNNNNNNNHNNNKNNDNEKFGLDDFYTLQPIEQYTDKLTNQTSFNVNFHNAYNMVEHFVVDNINQIKCKYCKCYYFPKSISKQNNNNNQSKRPITTLKKIINNEQQVKTYTCELCGSLNEIKDKNFIKQFPKFNNQPTNKDNNHHQYNSNFQSVIVSQTNSIDFVQKVNIKVKQNELIFVFCIDLDMLSQSIQLSTLTYMKTVIKQCFSRHIQLYLDQHNNYNQDKQQNLLKQRQNYLIMLTFNINEKLFVGDINTMSTICIDSLLKQKISYVNVQDEKNIKQMQQRENERKQNLLQLLYQSSLKIHSLESIQRFQQYMDMLIEQKETNDTNKRRFSLQSSLNFTKLMQLLSVDKSPSHSYVVSWVGTIPVINYEPHRVKKSNIYSLVYLFCQQQSSQSFMIRKNQSNNNSTKHFITQPNFHQQNVRNQLLLIKQNNQVRFVHFIQQQENTEFYYLLYQLFDVIHSPKIFRPRWTVKTDAKYPPVLTNDPPAFFIKNPTFLYFIISSLIDKSGHNKFQLSVQYQNWKKQQHIWIINWTKDTQKQCQQLKIINGHKQIQLLYKMPQIFNYFHILIKFIMNVAIRGKNDILQNKRSKLMSLNTVKGDQFCMIIQSMINNGVFKSNSVQISIQYLSRLYEYLSMMKSVPYEVLRLLGCCQYNIRSAIQMILPLVISNRGQQNHNACVIYWSIGYMVVDDSQNDDDNNNDDSEWPQVCMSLINQHYENKYYTRQFILKQQQHNNRQTYSNQITKYFTQKTYINQSHFQQNQYKQYNTSSQYNQNIKNKQKSHAITEKSLPSSIKIVYQPEQYQNNSVYQ